ncbi:PucR family transcriptional regulator [Agarivorans aestuarii]|uniref:PucR family transcriptional regulator n=1 Tax=Agarivorans aestuarii TaxID=1563703 RepID=UPI001C820A43|nr:PucR family transcriptional regulator ligand-binding domain-containing protein [Agarivorans aestuarii]
MAIRAKDIPLIPGLESINLLTGEASQQAIRWPYLAENKELAPWLTGGELVFVTGINLQRSEQEYYQLIDEALEKSAAGMVILTHSEFIDTIPECVISYANQHQFAVLEQPYSLPMVKVTELICKALIQDNLSSHSLQHFISHVINSPNQLSLLSRHRAKELGLNFDAAISIAQLQPQVSDASDLNVWVFQLRQWLNRMRSPYPLIEDHHGWYLLLPIQAQDSLEQQRSLWQQLNQYLMQLKLKYNLGVSVSPQGLNQLANAALQARQAAEFSQLQSHHSAIVHYLDLGVSRVFAAIEDPQILLNFCCDKLGPLFHCQEPSLITLKHTLRCYFDNLASLRQTAKELNIHRNTLSNRLAKVQTLTGCDLEQAQQRLELQNALLMEPITIQRQQHSVQGLS